MTIDLWLASLITLGLPSTWPPSSRGLNAFRKGCP